MSLTARSILYGLTLGVLLALLIAPQSGWLVRYQALSLLPFAPLPGYGLRANTTEQRGLEATALSHPGDYQIQYASTLGSGMGRTEELRRLETRFPDSASLRANVLHHAAQAWTVLLRSHEDDLLEQSSTPSSNLPHVSDAVMLSAFDQDAVEGERLDPDNAYFPLMRAVGLYAGHRDAEARAAILRAGTKTQWKEYYDDEVSGAMRLHTLAFGDRSAVWFAVVVGAELFPHYTLLRSAGRIATYQAMRDEKTGNVKEGVALRHALIHCGGLMRAQSQTIIGSIVGMLIAQTAMQRPGGAPWVKETETITLSLPAVDVSYAAYLHRSGFEAEAHYVLAEGKADQQARSAISYGMNFLTSVYPGSVLYLMCCWLANLTLLTVIPWLLLLRVLSATLARIPSVREARPLPGWASWGAAAGTLAALGVLLFVALTLDGSWDNFSAGFASVVLLLMITLPILILWRAQGRQFQRRSIGRGLGIAALTCAGWCGIYALAQWQTTGLQNFIGIIGILMGSDDNVGFINFLTGSDYSGGAVGGPSALQFSAPLVALAVPPLLVVTLGVISRVRRVPVSVGLVSGCQAMCLPLACALLLAYGGMTLVTLHQERAVNNTLTHELQGQGAYVAARTGQVWPGVVPER